jgi:hypothetical protein
VLLPSRGGLPAHRGAFNKSPNAVLLHDEVDVLVAAASSTLLRASSKTAAGFPHTAALSTNHRTPYFSTMKSMSLSPRHLARSCVLLQSRGGLPAHRGAFNKSPNAVLLHDEVDVLVAAASSTLLRASSKPRRASRTPRRFQQITERRTSPR